MRKLSEKDLLKMKKDLQLQLMKSYSLFGGGEVKTKEGRGSESKPKGFTQAGVKTSLSKDIRRNLARINTLLTEKKNEGKFYVR